MICVAMKLFSSKKDSPSLIELLLTGKYGDFILSFFADVITVGRLSSLKIFKTNRKWNYKTKKY